MRVLVFGCGWLGNRIANDIDGTLVPTDICDLKAVRSVIDHFKPDAVVNAAGKTGRPNVDWCESNRSATYRSNVIGALTLAEVCQDKGVYLIHFGSGCIFYGSSPHADGAWRESDYANPESYYSRTKYAADLLLSPLPNVAVVRLRMPIDGVPWPRNLITKLAGYRQVIDVENSVTVVDDLVRVIDKLLDVRASGVFHAVNPGPIRHSRLLELYREIVDPTHRCEMIREEDLVVRGLAKAPRSNCILADTRLAPLGITMRPTEEVLPIVMKQYARAM